ncbi:MAG: hypothetical protein JKY71_01005 [Alphaproteobacteria bacterium]|nr:hypothetical protein [Alphaproteobacteria bacterium]
MFSFLSCSIVSLCLYDAYADPVPVPDKKPAEQAESEDAGSHPLIEAIMNMGRTTFESGSSASADEQATPDNADQPGVVEEEPGDIAFIPLPPKKPKNIPKPRSTIERLMIEAQGRTYDEPIKSGQAELYGQIFEAQHLGDMKKAGNLAKMDLDKEAVRNNLAVFSRFRKTGNRRTLPKSN